MYASRRNAEERASILRTTNIDLYELLARKLTEEFRRRRLHTNPNFNSIGLTYDFREEPPGFSDFVNAVTQSMQQTVSPTTPISEYVAKFRHFTLLSMCAEKLVCEMFAKGDFQMRKTGTRGEYTVFEVQASAQLMRFATWHAKIRVPTLYAVGVITLVDNQRNILEVVFKDLNQDTNEKQRYGMQIIFDDHIHFAALRTLRLINSGEGRFAVMPNAEGLTELTPFMAKCNTYASTIDKNVPFNRCQKQAIYAIVNGVHGSVPFILWGPPGTGKTVTLVECVKQLIIKSRTNRILICAPSNTAADLLALKLLENNAVKVRELRRYYALGRHVNERNSALDNIVCMTRVNCFGEMINVFSVDTRENMLKISVFVTTLTFCSEIEELERGFFTHIFIDETAQSFEPETLLPITRFATERTRVILCGDHQQLGPIVTTQFLNNHADAQFKSCSRSLMERLMTTYSKIAYNDKRTTCKLLDSYRCHPAILRFPSNKFYGGALNAVSKDRNSLCNWKHLPNKNNFPVIFHLLDGGSEERQVGSTSYYNPQEAEIIVTYVELLLKSGVQPRDIGIVSPYKNQKRVIREKVSPEITVDSVECFQGSERRVIIVTTARSGSIGFMGDNKRVNTIITRAMELLIVISSDGLIRRMNESLARQYFRFFGFFQYCVENKAVVAHIVNRDPVRDLATRLEQLGYNPVEKTKGEKKSPIIYGLSKVEQKEESSFSKTEPSSNTFPNRTSQITDEQPTTSYNPTSLTLPKSNKDLEKLTDISSTPEPFRLRVEDYPSLGNTTEPNSSSLYNVHQTGDCIVSPSMQSEHKNDLNPVLDSLTFSYIQQTARMSATFHEFARLESPAPLSECSSSSQISRFFSSPIGSPSRSSTPPAFSDQSSIGESSKASSPEPLRIAKPLNCQFESTSPATKLQNDPSAAFFGKSVPLDLTCQTRNVNAQLVQTLHAAASNSQKHGLPATFEGHDHNAESNMVSRPVSAAIPTTLKSVLEDRLLGSRPLSRATSPTYCSAEARKALMDTAAQFTSLLHDDKLLTGNNPNNTHKESGEAKCDKGGELAKDESCVLM
ncbi:AAA domain-containing protein [Ditylenchus destructor]|nr:AAA domain-containing protein [Ditylenchus destructor]